MAVALAVKNILKVLQVRFRVFFSSALHPYVLTPFRGELGAKWWLSQIKEFMKSCSPLCKKIFLGMSLVGLVPLLIMAFQNHYFARKTIRTLEVDHLELALKTRMLWLRTWISHTRQEVYLTGFHRPDEGHDGPQPALDSTASIRHSIFELFRGHGKFRSLVLYDHLWNAEVLLPETFDSPPFEPAVEMKTALEKGGMFDAFL